MILGATSVNPKKIDAFDVVLVYLILMGLSLSDDKESLKPSSYNKPKDEALVAYWGISSVTDPKVLKSLMEELRDYCHQISGGYRFCWTEGQSPRETFSNTQTLNITIYVSEVKKLKGKSLPKDFKLPSRVEAWLKNTPAVTSQEDCYKGM